jgi:dTMP kinase
MLNELATGGLVPDLTLLFDLDPVEGLRRRGETGHLNTMDRRELEFHQRVRAGYLVLAGEEPDRWLVLDATQPLDVIHERIIARIRDHSASASLLTETV